jgi:hypothetical protein
LPDTTTDADVRAAEDEAQAAQRAFLDLEYRALHSPLAERPSASEVVAQRQEAEHAARRVEVTRERADEARAAARLAALAEIGAEVEAYAATDPAAGVHDALLRAAEAAGAYRQAVRAHDGAVADLSARAGALADAGGHTSPVLRGRGGSAVGYGDTMVLAFGDSARIALDKALGGDLAGGTAGLVAVKRGDQRPAPGSYYRDTVGQFGVMPCYGQPDRSLRMMIEEKRAVRMTDAEVATYLEGKQQA